MKKKNRKKKRPQPNKRILVPATDIAGQAKAVQHALNLHRSGRYQEAKFLYRKLLQQQPKSITILSNLANILKQEGKPDEAVVFLKKALRQSPEEAELYNNIGNAYTDLGKYDKALASFKKAVTLKENYAVAYNNMGSAYKAQNRLVEAVECYTRAIQADPSYAQAYDNMGRALLDSGHPEQSIVFFEQALACKPDFDQAVGNIVFAAMKTCRWDHFNTYGKMLDDLTEASIAKGQRPIEAPFLNISRCDDPKRNAQVAKAWSAVLANRSAAYQTSFSFGNRYPKSKITVGYLSNNFHDHPMAHLMTGLFARHDSSRFSIHAYSCGPDDGSGFRRNIKDCCDKFVDLERFSSIQAAELIHSDRVDILIDTMGYTKGHRLDISALRPAPVQARYLGMAGTTGAEFFDYIIADRTVIPPDNRVHYSERVVYMPDCYQVNNDGQPIASTAFKREELGLPDEVFIFCSFNQPYKIDPILFDCWMRILAKVPESVLWLQAGQESVKRNLWSEAEKRGVAAHRIVFAVRLPKPEHLSRLKVADLALDTRLVSGAATTSDALWAGLPVITVQGNHFASRMTSSILKAIELPELILNDLIGYERKAISLARSPDELERVRRKLAANRHSRSLFDTRGFTKNMERAYETMWQRYIDCLPPQHILT